LPAWAGKGTERLWIEQVKSGKFSGRRLLLHHFQVLALAVALGREHVYARGAAGKHRIEASGKLGQHGRAGSQQRLPQRAAEAKREHGPLGHAQ
nr:hypothetical protein [Tanacetum cinerariifolium]